MLDASFNPLLLLERLSSCLLQATAAHSALQFWTEANGYAITLTTRQHLQSYTHGSVKLSELIDWLAIALDYRDELEEMMEAFAAGKDPRWRYN
jgi:hypothetical protein